MNSIFRVFVANSNGQCEVSFVNEKKNIFAHLVKQTSKLFEIK